MDIRSGRRVEIAFLIRGRNVHGRELTPLQKFETVGANLGSPSDESLSLSSPLS